MNPQIPIEARQTILDFITAGTSFTAYEVTLEVRRRLGTSIDVPHSAVNSIVQTMFSKGEIVGYDRRADATVQSATPPFRYFQQGGAVAAPFTAPTAPAISRSNLPVALRFAGDIRRALLRNYSLAAREFQIAGGKADEPFALYIPSFKDLVFRVRCYGTGWDFAEVERQFTLDPNASATDLRWLTALAYTDEFRVYSNHSGHQTQCRVALDPTIAGTVTREAERATGEPDGLEIEIPVVMRAVSGLPALAFDMFRHFRVPPRLYQDGKLMTPNPATALIEGESWLLTEATAPLILADEVPYPSYYSPQLLGSGFRLKLATSDLDLEPNGENLANTPRTREAIEGAAAVVETEFLDALNRRLESANDLLEAKQIYGQISRHLGAPDDYIGYGVADNDEEETDDEPAHISERVSGRAQWRGIAVDSDYFRWPDDLAGVEVRRYAPSGNKTKVNMRRVQTIQIGDNMPIFLDDIGDKTISRRMEGLYQSAPFDAAYTISFADDNARAGFFRETNFNSVPTHKISELPAPAAPPRAIAAANSSTRTTFDAKLHQIKMPTGAVAASFAAGDDGSDDDFDELKKWARTAELDGKNWPDFKRTYKAVEARLWPPMGRFRWDKTEADFPATPIPNQRELELLGVMMGQLDEINAARGAAKTPAAPQPTIAQRALNAVSNLIGGAQPATAGGPSDDTLAYMKRRATKLLKFLRDNSALSEERRNALAPLVSGLLQREKCADINATLPLRLKLTETEVLANHPDGIARVWADTTLPFNVLQWAYQWLDDQGQNIAVSPAQLRRFVEYPDVEWTLKLAPAALRSGEKWPSDFGVKEFSLILQGKAKGTASASWLNTQFLQRRGEILDLFARFPQLKPGKRWLHGSLEQVSDTVTLDWLAPWLTEWAENGDFSLIETMSEALRIRFNAAIVVAFPQGLTLEKWRELSDKPQLLRLMSPALRELPISSAIADFIWGLPADQRDPILSALENNPALLPIIEDHARRLDFAFITPLSDGQWAHFARVVGQNFPDGISADNWLQVAQLPFESGYEGLPLGKNFWKFALPLESDARAQWIARVGAQRAGAEFAGQSAAVFEQLLESDATGLDALGDAWLDAHLHEVVLDGELILKLAQSNVSDWQARALAHLQSAELRLPVALRLMESELPLLESVATPFFRDENADWSDRVLALADSPKMAARALALQLLEEFPGRWTPDLLRNLAQHDDAGMQAFVAEQLENAPTDVVESKAVEAFDSAIINARGRARRAKESVKARASNEGEFDRETLLEAARNGAPRDREWALKQLVLASLSGADVDGLEVAGAYAKALELIER